MADARRKFMLSVRGRRVWLSVTRGSFAVSYPLWRVAVNWADLPELDPA